jgi:hypothetical protein
MRAGRELERKDFPSRLTCYLTKEEGGRGVSPVELLERSSETATSIFCTHEKLDAVPSCYSPWRDTPTKSST